MFIFNDTHCLPLSSVDNTAVQQNEAAVQTATRKIKNSPVAEHPHTMLMQQTKTWMADCVTLIFFLLVLTSVTSMTPVNFSPKSPEKSLLSTCWKMPLAVWLKGTTGACVCDWSGIWTGFYFGQCWACPEGIRGQHPEQTHCYHSWEATGVQREEGWGYALPSRNWAWHFSDVFVRKGRFSVLMRSSKRAWANCVEPKCTWRFQKLASERAHAHSCCLTWPAPHCRGTWLTLVPGCTPGPWRQTAGHCPPHSPVICWCSGAQSRTRDCTRTLMWTSMNAITFLSNANNSVLEIFPLGVCIRYNLTFLMVSSGMWKPFENVDFCSKLKGF